MELITKQVKDILTNKYNKLEFSELLGISRPTLDTRLKKHNWKKTEVSFIKKMLN